MTTFLLRSETTLGCVISSVLSDIAIGGTSQCDKARNKKRRDWGKKKSKCLDLQTI